MWCLREAICRSANRFSSPTSRIDSAAIHTHILLHGKGFASTFQRFNGYLYLGYSVEGQSRDLDILRRQKALPSSLLETLTRGCHPRTRLNWVQRYATDITLDMFQASMVSPTTDPPPSLSSSLLVVLDVPCAKGVPTDTRPQDVPNTTGSTKKTHAIGTTRQKYRSK